MALLIKLSDKYNYLDKKINIVRPNKKQKTSQNITQKLTFSIKNTYEYFTNLLMFIKKVNKTSFFDLLFDYILLIQFTDEISSKSKNKYLINVDNYLIKNNCIININKKKFYINKFLGSGTYSLVFEIKDLDDNKYAIKIFNNYISKKFVDKEINFLKKLNNYNSFINCFSYDNSPIFKYVVLEKIKYNLYEFIINNANNYIPLKLIFKFMKSLLHCLKILKHEKIIHSDIKLENIMINSCDINQIIEKNIPIKLIDFSLSIDKYKGETNTITYIQSRFYRSIEATTRYKYDYPLDIWSVGCVLFELYTKIPLFPSVDEFDHFKMITQIFGMPHKNMIESFKSYFKLIKKEKVRTSKYSMYDKILNYIDNYNYYNVLNSSQEIIKSKIIKHVSNVETSSYEFDVLCYIISNMLILDPYQRIDIDQAICINQLTIDEYLNF
jgi:serine/threonine protein kinase